MKKWSNRIILLLIVLYILEQYYSSSILAFLMVLLTVFVTMISLSYSRNLPKIFSVIMLSTGTLILLIQNAKLDIWIESITKNLPMVSLIIIVPILSVPINLGKYDNNIAELIVKFNGSLKLLYLFLTSLFYILGPITNLGSIHIINSMVQKLKLPAEFLGRVYVRGFSSINTWAPYFASVFLVVYYLEIPMAEFLPYEYC